MPAVSVVLPTYNRAHCLERAVRSVALQSFEDWEFIIVDDGSTDATPELCRVLAGRLGTKFRVFRLENGGVSRARNFGIAQARAPLVAFQDSDDFWYLDKLALQVAALGRSRDAQFSFTGFSQFDEDGRSLVERADIPPEFSGRIYPDLYRIHYNVIMTPSVVCGADLLRSVGGFDTQMTMCEDIDLWGRLLARTQAVVVNRPLVGISVSPDGTYPFAQAFRARATLYRNFIARDAEAGAAMRDELFGELFTVLRREAMRCGRPAIAAAASEALAILEQARDRGQDALFLQAVASMEAALAPARGSARG